MQQSVVWASIKHTVTVSLCEVRTGSLRLDRTSTLIKVFCLDFLITVFPEQPNDFGVKG